MLVLTKAAEERQCFLWKASSILTSNKPLFELRTCYSTVKASEWFPCNAYDNVGLYYYHILCYRSQLCKINVLMTCNSYHFSTVIVIMQTQIYLMYVRVIASDNL